MKLHRYFKFFLVIATASVVYGTSVAQKVVMREYNEVIALDITQETATNVNWGETEQGLMTRCNLSFTNPYSETIKVIQVRADENCFPGRQEGMLNFAEVKPGETYSFFVLSKGDDLGPVSSKVELVIEHNGKRYHRSSFVLSGEVSEAAELH